jgi:hypothetical protein
VKRVAVVRDATVTAGSGGFASIQTAASSSGVELTPVGVHDAEEVERGITDFASRPNGGLIVVGPPSSVASYRDLIVSLAARHHLPAVYATLAFVGNGALISYGGDHRAPGQIRRKIKLLGREPTFPRRRQARGRGQERPPAADPPSGGAATGRTGASLVPGRIVAPSQRPATTLRCAVTRCGRDRQRCRR